MVSGVEGEQATGEQAEGLGTAHRERLGGPVGLELGGAAGQGVFEVDRVGQVQTPVMSTVPS